MGDRGGEAPQILALKRGVGSTPWGFLLLGVADGVFPTVELAGNGISIVLLIFTILEFCIAVATANFWCRATRLSSNEVGQGMEGGRGGWRAAEGDEGLCGGDEGQRRG